MRMASPQWGNDGRPHCIHLWVPCAVYPDIVWDEGRDTATYLPPVGQKPVEFVYKICVRPECRKVLT